MRGAAQRPTSAPVCARQPSSRAPSRHILRFAQPRPPRPPCPCCLQRPRHHEAHPLLPSRRHYADAQGAAAPLHRAGAGGPGLLLPTRPALPVECCGTQRCTMWHGQGCRQLCREQMRRRPCALHRAQLLHTRTLQRITRPAPAALCPADGARPHHPGGGPGQAGGGLGRAVRGRRAQLCLPGGAQARRRYLGSP